MIESESSSVICFDLQLNSKVLTEADFAMPAPFVVRPWTLVETAES
ncbi:hypothetical protein [Coriobacterium glomerans]|nr:hypothetical protein [Coriobacterium glomerans]